MYSVDLRQTILSFWEKGWSVSKICREFKISRSNFYLWSKQNAAGCLAPKGWGFREKKLNKEKVLAYLAEHPDHTLKEMAPVFNVHFSALSYFFKRHKIKLKKKRHSIPNAKKRNDSNFAKT